MKATIPALVLLTVALAAYAAPPAPKKTHAGGVEVCASDADMENLCTWDAPKGTHGRKCVLDVERIDRKSVCAYDRATSPEMTDHKPMCISAAMAEHIVFRSSRGRAYRVRRLVPINKTNAQGAACPAHPFRREFHPEDFNFGDSFDTEEPKSDAIGCRYKLEVQFDAEDSTAPIAPNDPKHRRLECRDPHLGITGGSGS